MVCIFNNGAVQALYLFSVIIIFVISLPIIWGLLDIPYIIKIFLQIMSVLLAPLTLLFLISILVGYFLLDVNKKNEVIKPGKEKNAK